MINKVKKLLNTPIPLGFGVKYAFIAGLTVFFILTVLSPFGFAELPFLRKIFKSLTFGFITFLSVAANFKLSKFLLPHTFHDDYWTMKHEILYNIYDIFLIGFWNALFLFISDTPNLTFIKLLYFVEINTFLIGSVPVIALIAYKKNEFLKNELKELVKLNEELHQHLKKQSKGNDQITLLSEKNKAEIKLHPSEILYLKSEGNYVEVFYMNENEIVNSHLIRNRLKVISDILPDNIFFQPHKSYIINAQKILKVKGNMRDYKLILRGTDHQIPVSRSRTKELHRFFENK